ncbi:hypothetical protein MesoLjLc_51290 [Mesorhizobium sp. L-8-10]|uniref:hypothetical protein n=1 Tax=Mesorhizobium sp. L-8-10 TaxID=2744523 RepID=UPI0019275E87|nr:hypothetical protein [Mesorhizobium sp. L-8-10]BCH33199.1 hypothetical protein MesoLjLc_51290 [Mesorhizobium sp. L-8-10]
MAKLTFHMGITLRCYGNVEVEADSIEAAFPMLTADFVGEHIDITETTTDSGQDLAIIDVSDADTGEELASYDGYFLPSPYDQKPDAELLAALTDARTFLCDSYPLRLGDGLRYVALRKQMDAAIARAEGTPDPDAALIAAINAAKPGKVWCFIAGMHPHPRMNDFLLGVAVLGEAGWEPVQPLQTGATYNAVAERSETLNKRLPWSAETCIAIVADTMRRSEQKRQAQSMAEAERERIAQALDDEADTTPCMEDAKVVRDCARLVRADFSYEEAERLAEAEGRTKWLT